MPPLIEYAEDYVRHALKQTSTDKKGKKQLQKKMDKYRKDFIDNYISRRNLSLNRDVFGRYDRKSRANLKQASDAFDHRVQSVVTQMNEETERKNKMMCKIKTKEECVSRQNINNCYWNEKLKKNQYGETLEPGCQKITKRSIQIGKRTRRKVGKPTNLASISEEGDVDSESEELSTNALTAEQRRLLTLEALNLGKDMSAGKRKRKTRKRKRRRTKKKRRRKRRKSRRKKTRKKRGKGPAFSKMLHRKETRKKNIKEAQKNVVRAYADYMDKIGDQTGKSMPAEQLNKEVKKARSNVFHPNTLYYTEKPYKERTKKYTFPE